MRLTDLLIKSLKPPERGQKTYFDDSIKGFGIRVSMGGTKSFVLMYGKKRKLKTIGRYPALSLSEARTMAKQVQGEVVAQIRWSSRQIDLPDLLRSTRTVS
ncbi:MAG: DUF4102 domain-containing protein [Rhizobiales bacterium]|nr:DUF4102 domain-containing protein [Hyphomicrobiales bacterium]